jgi:hypothetical protein
MTEWAGTFERWTNSRGRLSPHGISASRCRVVDSNVFIDSVHLAAALALDPAIKRNCCNIPITLKLAGAGILSLTALISSIEGYREVFRRRSLFSCSLDFCMNAQRIWWRRPGVVALAAVVILINCVVDWWVFKPQSLAMFVAIEVVITGGIIWLAVAFPNRPV